MSLVITDLHVAYGANVVLDSVDLTINTGERFAIMGPSGSGKSSLIRAIAGIVPSHGTVVVDGIDISDTPTHARPIGLMFQDYALFPHMNVADNVGYGLKMVGIAGPERDEITTAMLTRVGLSGFGKRSVTALSGGEQQRVALARTLVTQPAVVMLDEPLGSLDFALRESLLTHMRSVVTDVGTTTIYVTHDRGEAFAFADRVAVLVDGQIAAIDTPEGLWNNPRTVQVARLIGHQTVVDGADIGLDGWMAIPAEAVTVDSNGSLQGIVTDSTFTDGVYRSTILIGSSSIHVTTRTAPTTGVQVSISVDPSRTIAVDQA